MRTENDELAERIRALEAQVESLGGELDLTSPEAIDARAKTCATEGRGGGCSFLEPSEQTLIEMAKCATVKVDSPSFLDDRERPRVDTLAQRLGMSDAAENEKFQAAASAHYESYNAGLRAMYLEMGGSEEFAADASSEALVASLSDQLDPDLIGTVQRHIAEERAGLREPPTSDTGLSVEERLFRLKAEKGNVFEAYLAREFGPERARSLRARSDGWPGNTSVFSSDCVE